MMHLIYSTTEVDILKIPTAWQLMKNNLQNTRILARTFIIMYGVEGCPMVKE